jgi:radical SAM protein with 4Fe4S-binding SPASM domain
MVKSFKKTYIEITNVCNLSCSFCPKTRRSAEYMKADLFRHILMQIKDYSKHLYFHVLGEPLIHPELGYFLDLCHDYGYLVNITTNGTLIERLSKEGLIKPALRQVNISLHSFEANASRDSIEKYLDNVFKFVLEAREKSKLQICLRLWNIGDKQISTANSYVLESIEKAFSLPFKLEEKLTPCNGLKLRDGVFLNQSSSFKWPDINDPDNEGVNGFCYGLRDQIAILVDGTVVPCCLDGEGGIPLGNIQETPFSEIINSTRAVAMYEGFSNRKVIEPLCRKCQYRQRFNI